MINYSLIHEREREIENNSNEIKSSEQLPTQEKQVYLCCQSAGLFPINAAIPSF